MFFIKKETEKPNYAKIVGITLGIIAGVAAAGYAAYLYCQKKGIKLCICKSGSCDDECWDDEDILEELESIEGDDAEIEVETEVEGEEKAE